MLLDDAVYVCMYVCMYVRTYVCMYISQLMCGYCCVVCATNFRRGLPTDTDFTGPDYITSPEPSTLNCHKNLFVLERYTHIIFFLTEGGGGGGV